MKRVLSIVLFLSMMLSVIMPANAVESDFNGHWAKPYIEKLNAQGVMKGDGNGMFRPNGLVTRAEFVTLVNHGFGFVKDNGQTFSDVKPSD